jgi:hypothetical protein
VATVGRIGPHRPTTLPSRPPLGDCLKLKSVVLELLLLPLRKLHQGLQVRKMIRRRGYSRTADGKRHATILIVHGHADRCVSAREEPSRSLHVGGARYHTRLIGRTL